MLVALQQTSFPEESRIAHVESNFTQSESRQRKLRQIELIGPQLDSTRLQSSQCGSPCRHGVLNHIASPARYIQFFCPFCFAGGRGFRRKTLERYGLEMRGSPRSQAQPPFAQEWVGPSESKIGDPESKEANSESPFGDRESIFLMSETNFRNPETKWKEQESIFGFSETGFLNAESKNWRSESDRRHRESQFQSRVSPSS